MTSRFADHILGPDTHTNRPAASGVPYGALYKCSTHNLIYQNVAGTWATWASFSGFTDPTTTKGDLLTRDASDLARLAVGSNGTSLVADSAQTLGMKYENRVKSVVAGTNVTVDNTDPLNPIVAASGGGGGGSSYALDPATLNATYGDHFTGASLDAAWTRVGYTSTGESYQKGGGTWLQQDTSKGAANYYWRTAPSGDFSIVMSGIVYGDGKMFGPMILDSSGNGIQGAAYNSGDGHWTFGCTGASYNSTNTNISMPTGTHVNTGARTWYKLTKTGTSYVSTLSTNGQVWRPPTSAVTSFTTTPTRIGFGNIFGTCIGFAIDFFDVQ